MFLQILMLTRQNKCHVAYFFNPCVLPSGFPCSEALTQCCVVWSPGRKAELGRSVFATNRWLLRGLGQDPQYLGQVYLVENQKRLFKSWLHCFLGPQSSLCSFLGPRCSQRSKWRAWERALWKRSCSKDGRPSEGRYLEALDTGRLETF